MAHPISIHPIIGLPLVKEGDDLAALILKSLSEQDLTLDSGDVLVLAQKIVSKTEGRLIDLTDIEPSDLAITLSKEVDKDPRIVELILSESDEVVRHARGVLIVAHKLGFVHANAGIDQSNVEGQDTVLLLPKNSDTSAQNLRKNIEAETGKTLGVVIADSFGRAWRKGTVGVAIGASGVDTLLDERGKQDLVGRDLEITEIGRADEIAAAAGLVMGQAGEGIPVALVKGLKTIDPQEGVGNLLRAKMRTSSGDKEP